VYLYLCFTSLCFPITKPEQPPEQIDASMCTSAIRAEKHKDGDTEHHDPPNYRNQIAYRRYFDKNFQDIRHTHDAEIMPQVVRILTAEISDHNHNLIGIGYDQIKSRFVHFCALRRLKRK
jgi:hypothetical protein